jgi:GT2 family glycosyltransferase
MVISPPKIGVVILNYNSCRDTLGCLEALRKAAGGERRTWVVDNASEDGSQEQIPPKLLQGEEWLETGENLGYAGGNNAGIRAAMVWGAEYVLILNPDCRVEPDFLPPLVRALEGFPKAGMACPLVLGEDGSTVQSLGGEVNLWTGRCGRRFYGAPAEAVAQQRWSEVDFPHGACVLIRRGMLEDVGLFNEAYFLYYEDVELGLRARREKWTTLAIPHSRVRHADTTIHGRSNPVVCFHGTRNQAWVVAEYGRPVQRVAYLVLSCYGRWPLKALGKALLGDFQAAKATALGAWKGHHSKAWRAVEHLAVPWEGHPKTFVEPE